MASGRQSYKEAPHRARFGARVRVLRDERELTQEALAERASIDRSYLADLERGGRNPTLDLIYRLAEALQVQVGDLFPADRSR